MFRITKYLINIFISHGAFKPRYLGVKSFAKQKKLKARKEKDVAVP